MRRLRSTWGLRLTAAVLAAALLPVAAAPVLVATGPSVELAASTAYADWLRAQLAEPATPAFEAAVEAARASEAASMDAFLRAFTEAYAGEPGAAPLAHLFAAPDGLDAGALVSHLRSLFQQLGAGGLLPTATLAAAAFAAAGGPERAVQTLPARLFARAAHRAVAAVAASLAVVPVRVLSAARPNGP